MLRPAIAAFSQRAFPPLPWLPKLPGKVQPIRGGCCHGTSLLLRLIWLCGSGCRACCEPPAPSHKGPLAHAPQPQQPPWLCMRTCTPSPITSALPSAPHSSGSTASMSQPACQQLLPLFSRCTWEHGGSATAAASPLPLPARWLGLLLQRRKLHHPPSEPVRTTCVLRMLHPEHHRTGHGRNISLTLVSCAANLAASALTVEACLLSALCCSAPESEWHCLASLPFLQPLSHQRLRAVLNRLPQARPPHQAGSLPVQSSCAAGRGGHEGRWVAGARSTLRLL